MIQFNEERDWEAYPSDEMFWWDTVQDGKFWEYLKGSIAATSYNINKTY